MKKHRIFIAINLPPDIKKKFKEYQQKFESIFVERGFKKGELFRWTKEPSLHITLAFIGYVDEDQLVNICRLMKIVAKKYEAFNIVLNNIDYGPPSKTPRMIWIGGDVNDEFLMLKKDIDDALVQQYWSGFYRIEKRAPKIHITLGRRKSIVGGLPEIKEKVNIIIPVNSIEVMESELKKDGAEYTVFETCNLGLEE